MAFICGAPERMALQAKMCYNLKIDTDMPYIESMESLSDKQG
jgi:hypothetical protein